MFDCQCQNNPKLFRALSYIFGQAQEPQPAQLSLSDHADRGLPDRFGGGLLAPEAPTPGLPLARRLVLASTSRYRRMLLERLGIAFEVFSADVDESRLTDESPARMAQRLAEAKARAAMPRFPDSLVIGCDQVAESAGRIFGKPGNHANATEQLLALSGAEAVFHNGLCVIDTSTGATRARLVPFHVRFRRLDAGTIERYLLRETPYDCAGSARSEGLGIALMESLRGDDPNALIGLPLIALVDLLGEFGVHVP